MRKQVRASAVREGAAPVAPTAPHATFPTRPNRKMVGPEKFWDRRRVRVALAMGFLVSLFAHYWIGPWRFLPQDSLRLVDVAGELTIPVDLLGEDTPPPTPSPPPAPAEPDKPKEGEGIADASPPKKKKKDAAVEAASPLASELDAGDVEIEADGGAETPADAGVDDAGDGGGLLAEGADAGAGGGKEPNILEGMPGMDRDPPNVVLLVNTRLVRNHPVGGRLGPLLSAIPQWDDFMAGTNIDPVNDGDWILIYGPSLWNTSRDAILIHYTVPDKAVDRAIDLIKQRSHNGRAFDAGVPNVKATLAHADRAPRVFLRMPNHVVAIVPPDRANEQARFLVRNGAVLTSRVPKDAAVYLKMKQPSQHIKDRDGDPVVPASVSQLVLWVRPRADGSAQILGDGDCTDEEGASEAADKLRRFIRRQNSVMVRAFTQGLLNPLENERGPNGDGLRAEGAKLRLQLTVSKEQLEAILQLLASRFGVTLKEPDGPGAEPSGATPSPPASAAHP